MPFYEGFLENFTNSIETEWETVLTDTDLETTIKWCRTNHILGESIVEIKWSIGDNTEPGFYRVRHVGYYKVSIEIFPFIGLYKLDYYCNDDIQSVGYVRVHI